MTEFRAKVDGGGGRWGGVKVSGSLRNLEELFVSKISLWNFLLNIITLALSLLQFFLGSDLTLLSYREISQWGGENGVQYQK